MRLRDAGSRPAGRLTRDMEGTRGAAGAPLADTRDVTPAAAPLLRAEGVTSLLASLRREGAAAGTGCPTPRGLLVEVAVGHGGVPRPRALARRPPLPPRHQTGGDGLVGRPRIPPPRDPDGEAAREEVPLLARPREVTGVAPPTRLPPETGLVVGALRGVRPAAGARPDATGAPAGRAADAPLRGAPLGAVA